MLHTEKLIYQLNQIVMKGTEEICCNLLIEYAKVPHRGSNVLTWLTQMRDCSNILMLPYFAMSVPHSRTLLLPSFPKEVLYLDKTTGGENSSFDRIAENWMGCSGKVRSQAPHYRD